MKWYEKILFVLILLILSPLILFFLIIWWISAPFITLSNRRQYKKSAYYSEFKIPYKKNIFESDYYTFFNYAKKENLPIRYVKQKNKSLDYFIYEGTIYIFPDFSEIKYNLETLQFEIIYRHYKEITKYSLEDFFCKKEKLFEEEINMPVKLLVSRNYFNEEFVNIDLFPENIYVVKTYDTAFKEVYFSADLIPHSTKELYEKMIQNKKIGGKIELTEGELIVWTFDKVIYEIDIDEYFGVFQNDKLRKNIIHWHPEPYEIYDHICSIGEIGNVLVVQKMLGGARILYMGPKEKCPIKKNKIRLGKTYFFEAHKNSIE